MSRSQERKTIPDGSVSCGGNQGVRGRSEPAESRLQPGLAAPQGLPESVNAARIECVRYGFGRCKHLKLSAPKSLKHPLRGAGHFTVSRSSSFGFNSIVTSLYSSNNPALCICQAIGPTLPAVASLKSTISTALPPGG